MTHDDARSAFIAEAQAAIHRPLSPTPLLDTIHAAWTAGWDHGYTAGLQAAIDEHHAQRLHARATAHVLANARIPTHHDLVDQRTRNTRSTADKYQARPDTPWPDDTTTGRPAA